jgi:hypothetical protein
LSTSARIQNFPGYPANCSLWLALRDPGPAYAAPYKSAPYKLQEEIGELVVGAHTQITPGQQQ